jgi:hypothetical protein
MVGHDEPSVRRNRMLKDYMAAVLSIYFVAEFLKCANEFSARNNR